MLKNFLKLKQNEIKRLNNKGITLIALVITIIILLILAGITIGLVTGDNGILAQATRAKEETEIAQEKEEIVLAYNTAVAKKQSADITAEELDEELKANDAGADAIEDGENIKVTFEESKREYIIDKNGNITEGGSGTVTPPTPDEPEESVPGKTYEKDTEVTVGEETVVVPGGATVSKIEGEYEDVDEGFVIYITNDEEITEEDWQDAETMQKTYDQFVWVPVKEALAVDMNGDNTIDKTDIDLMVAEGRYPMAIKTSESPETYKGILYDFTEEGGAVKVTAYDYNTEDSFREPDIISDYDEGDYVSEGITESSLQAEYNGMIKVVEEAGGFWVGRYETSKMSTDTSKDTSTTDFIQVIKGTTEGINNVNWYRMYAQQKNYEKHLSKSNVKSSMIWGSQWDQIMIWMKEEPNDVNTTNGGFYITNSVGMGNYGNISGVDDGYDDTNNPSATGCFDVKNIYDLAGNVYDWTLEANNTSYRVLHRRRLRLYQ